MTFAEITPVVLTWNEAANIERTLARLQWARRVLVFDSVSTDGTQAIARRFGNVVLEERLFDDHARQWEAAVRSAAVETDWVLALDADYVLSTDLISEIATIDLGAAPVGYRARFRYCIEGVPLRASLYPPAVVLFDRRRARFVQDGHTQRLVVEGPVADLAGRILHDDRKEFSRFLEAQRRYARLEAEKLRATPFRALPPSGKVRRLLFVAPWLVPLWLLIGRGLLLDGRRGLVYARQRSAAEWSITRALSSNWGFGLSAGGSKGEGGPQIVTHSSTNRETATGESSPGSVGSDR